MREQLLPQNPVALVQKPKIVAEGKYILGREEAQTLLRTADGTPYHALFVLAVTTGMRQGEILALHWAHVDLDAAQLFVAFSLAEDAQGHLVRKEPKTKASRRLIALPSITVEALRAHKARSKSDVGYVFTTGAGGPIWKRNFHSDVFKPLLKKAGLSDITFHSLRHTADTILLESGESLHVVQQRGG